MGTNGTVAQVSSALRWEVFERDDFTCQYCGRRAPNANLEVDHIKPISKGGTNVLGNLTTACVDCNRGKGTRGVSTRRDQCLAPGFVVQINGGMIGEIQAVDQYGVRITPYNFLVGMMDGWDGFVRWQDIHAVEIATPEHDVNRFLKVLLLRAEQKVAAESTAAPIDVHTEALETQLVRLWNAANEFWGKMHREGLCKDDNGLDWAECERLADELTCKPKILEAES